MRWTVFLLFVFGILDVMVIGVYASSLYPTQIELTTEEAQYMDSMITSDFYWEIPTIKRIAGEVATEREYILDIYDCTDFSRTLMNRLYVKGIDAECVTGIYDGDEPTKHTWVVANVEGVDIHIEAVHGYIIPSHYLTKYKIWYRGICW